MNPQVYPGIYGGSPIAVAPYELLTPVTDAQIDAKATK